MAYWCINKSTQVNLLINQDINEMMEEDPENWSELNEIESQCQKIEVDVQKLQLSKPHFFIDRPEIDQIACPYEKAEKYLEFIIEKWPDDCSKILSYIDLLEEAFEDGLGSRGLWTGFDNYFKVYEEKIKFDDPDCYMLMHYLVMFRIWYDADEGYSQERLDCDFKYGLNCALKVANDKDLVRYIYQALLE